MSATATSGYYEQTFADLKDFVATHATREQACSFGSALPAITAIFGSEAMESRMGRSWRHFACQQPQPDSFRYYFMDEATAKFRLPDLPWGMENIGVQGVIDGGDNPHRKAVWQHGSHALYLFDHAANWGLFWTKDARELPHWESSFPLRYLIAWLGEHHQGILAHAGAVGTEAGAVLLVGKGGSGKSTTSLSALAHGMDYLGDDYVMVQPGDQPMVYTLSTAAKVERSRLPMLGLDQLERHELGATEETEKRVVYLEDAFSQQIAPCRPLRAIMHPAIDASGPRIEPMTKAEMLKALAPSTLFQIPTNRQLVFQRLHRLTKQLPCHRFHIGPDLTENAACLKSFINENFS